MRELGAYGFRYDGGVCVNEISPFIVIELGNFHDNFRNIIFQRSFVIGELRTIERFKLIRCEISNNDRGFLNPQSLNEVGIDSEIPVKSNFYIAVIIADIWNVDTRRSKSLNEP